MNDRLLLNDGTGNFVDVSQARMAADMLESDFGTHADIADLNLDGTEDIVKDNALLNYRIRAAYNDPDNEGFFDIYDNVETTANPYDFDLGDLNKDRRPDIVVSSDAEDRYRYNLGVGPLGRVVWGPMKLFGFVGGADDGFAGNNLIADLNNDGWKDVIVTDVDVDVIGCDRRAPHLPQSGRHSGRRDRAGRRAPIAHGGLGRRRRDLPQRSRGHARRRRLRHRRRRGGRHGPRAL